jgi:hypothetical protein
MPIDPPAPTVTEPAPAEIRPVYHWYQKLSAILLIIFCLELGCFLLVFPWVAAVWDNNFFSSLLHSGYWDSGYFRGAVSGLGVINLYIAFVEILRLRRFW